MNTRYGDKRIPEGERWLAERRAEQRERRECAFCGVAHERTCPVLPRVPGGRKSQ